jgi:hypothetical protein
VISQACTNLASARWSILTTPAISCVILIKAKEFKWGKQISMGRGKRYRIVFSQGDAADTIYYLQKGKIKVVVLSEQGKAAVVETRAQPCTLCNLSAKFWFKLID